MINTKRVHYLDFQISEDLSFLTYICLKLFSIGLVTLSFKAKDEELPKQFFFGVFLNHNFLNLYYKNFINRPFEIDQD